MRVVVTGGAGFIGANLCHELVRRHVEVTAFDDLSTGDLANLNGLPVSIVVGSILDVPSLKAACAGADAIVHLAARTSVPRSLENPTATNEVNVTGTVRVLETARGLGAHVIVASSSSIYGRNPTLPKQEEMPPMPLSPYAVSKLAAESYTLAYADSFGLPTLALRFFNVFGPLQPATHDYAAVIPAFVSSALAGESLHIFGDGRQTRDFTYVATVTDVLADALARRKVCNRPINLALGTRTSLLRVVTTLEELLGCRLQVRHEPARRGDVRDSQADTRRLQEHFPGISVTPLRDGLQATLEWCRSLNPLTLPA